MSPRLTFLYTARSCSESHRYKMYSNVSLISSIQWILREYCKNVPTCSVQRRGKCTFRGAFVDYQNAPTIFCTPIRSEKETVIYIRSIICKIQSFTFFQSAFHADGFVCDIREIIEWEIPLGSNIPIAITAYTAIPWRAYVFFVCVYTFSIQIICIHLLLLFEWFCSSSCY